MKVKINELESYNANFENKEYTPQEFHILVERLSRMDKILFKDSDINLIQNQSNFIQKSSKYISKQPPKLKDISHDFALELLTEYYAKQSNMSKYGWKKRNSVSPVILKLIEKYKITPRAIGLKSYPKKGQSNMKSLLLPINDNGEYISEENRTRHIHENKSYIKWSKIWDTNEKLIQAGKEYWLEHSDMKKYIGNYKITRWQIGAALKTLIIKRGLIPQQFGLIRFPNTRDWLNMDEIRIKNNQDNQEIIQLESQSQIQEQENKNESTINS